MGTDCKSAPAGIEVDGENGTEKVAVVVGENGNLDKLGKSAGSIDELLTSLKQKTPLKGNPDLIQKFEADFGTDAGKLAEFDKAPELIECWDLLYRNGRTGGNNPANALSKNMDALKSLNEIRKNKHRSNLGLTDELLADLSGHFPPNGYSQIIDDLDKLATFAGENAGTKLDDFQKVVNQIKQTALIEKRKGAHGIIQAIIKNSDEFKGKKISFEKDVPNARPTNVDSKADIVIEETPPVYFEVKWMERKISKDEIVSQFIERDLYNVSSLDQIRWVQISSDYKLTKTDLFGYLQSTEGREALNNLLLDQNKLSTYKSWFNLSQFDDTIGPDQIQFFVNGHFEKIFK